MPEPVSTTVVPLAAFEAVKKVDDALGVLTKLVNTLTANPGVAAAKVAEVLGEIRKTYVVVDDAVVAYLNLAFEKDALTKGSTMLLDIANGKLEAKVEEGRGHCYRIEHIYGQHLNRWLTRIFNGMRSHNSPRFLPVWAAQTRISSQGWRRWPVP